MNLVTLNRRLDQFIARTHKAVVGHSLWIEIKGGLPRDVASRRRAFAGGQTFTPMPGETRAAFEYRVAMAARGWPIVLGGLPDLPGTTIQALETIEDQESGLDYWGDPVLGQ